MKTPTIAEIAAKNQEAGGHYFDRGTLRFFGQTRKDFRARTLKDGRIVVYSRQHRGWDIGGGIVSLAVFDKVTGDTNTPEDKAAVIAEIEG